MTTEVTKSDLIVLIKGLKGYESYERANDLEKMGAGKLTGFPNEKWEWNESFFDTRNDQQLFDFYKLLKSWLK